MHAASVYDVIDSTPFVQAALVDVLTPFESVLLWHLPNATGTVLDVAASIVPLHPGDLKWVTK